MSHEQVVYLAELTVFDPALGAEKVLRYSSGQGFITGGGDSPPHTYYAPRIKQPIDVTRDLFATGATSGATRVGYGDLVLINPDGELDNLLDYAFDGRELNIFRYGGEGHPRYSDFTLVIAATMTQAEFSTNSVTVKVRDRQYELTIPLQPRKYAGNNVLPNGLEGVAADLKGKVKPVCYGVVKNISPPIVNTSKLIFQVNDSAVLAVDAVYDRGVLLTRGASYASEADLLNDSLAPAAGTFRDFPGGGYFRVGTAPVGLVTADVTQGATAADRTAGQLFIQLLNRAADNNAFFTSAAQVIPVTDSGDTFVTDTGATLAAGGRWSDADILALDAANSAVLGFWTDEEMKMAAVVDLVASTPGAWWGVDRNGVFRVERLTAPEGVPVAKFTANDMKRPPERVAVNDEWRGLPVYRQVIRWGKNYAVQTSDIAASVTDARRGYLAQEWREAVTTDTSIQQKNLLAPSVEEESLFTVEADAQAEATRRLGLRGIRRDRFELFVPLTDETAKIDLGMVVEFSYPRYGLAVEGSAAGALFRVLGVAPNGRERSLRLNVWGRPTGSGNLVTGTSDFFVTDTGEYLLTGAA
ncbi:MAG TPA: hypothetical protein VNJ04_12365 [Gemmatimonadaceae bacterium]|nr:hypothetical protein [Gemmatimonadaceae bacterium]